MELTEISPVGRSEEHLQLVVEDRVGNAYRVIYWQGAGMETELRRRLGKGDLDLAYHARASDYYGQRKVQVEFVDLRLVESAPIEITTPRRPLDVVDCRREPQALLLLKQAVAQHSALVWAEAEAVLKLASKGVASVDRNHLAPADCMAIWTTPPGRRELQAALDQVHPRSLYLFCIDPETVKLEVYLNRLAGLVKYALRTNQGKISIPVLAAASGQRAHVVLKGLEWLAARQYIQIVALSEAEVLVSPAPAGGEAGVPAAMSPSNEQAESLLGGIKSLLAETSAFRAYFARADKEDLMNSSSLETTD
jgi:hypothetical protein